MVGLELNSIIYDSKNDFANLLSLACSQEDNRFRVYFNFIEVLSSIVHLSLARSLL